MIVTPSAEEGNDLSTKLSSYKEFTDIDETTANKVAEVNAQLVEIAGETVGYSEADLISEDAETYIFSYFACSYNPQWSVFSAISNQTKKNTK